MRATVTVAPTNPAFSGCDFVLQFPKGHSEDVRILQLTDMQPIDSTQRRTPDRIRPDEIEAWLPEALDGQCGDHIRSLVAQTSPDLIIITGDMVYGSFDDNGSVLRYMCELMDSFGIPWAPTFGNHDNESAMGVDWQCAQLLESQHCLFSRGEVTGNSNYTIGIAIGEELIRVIHMLDTNGCRSTDPAVTRGGGLYPDQLALVEKNTDAIRRGQGKEIPAFVACHIPPDTFLEAEYAKGYRTSDEDTFVIGVDVAQKDRDFGFSQQPYRKHTFAAGDGFVDYLRAVSVDGVFVGHLHADATSIRYRDITWTFGLKTAQYDSHLPYQLGGTLIALRGGAFQVQHVPSLVRCAPMPASAPMFRRLFACGNTEKNG